MNILTRRLTPYIFLWILLLPLCTSCEREDDVMEIFTGKTWKLSYIFLDGHSANSIDLWEGDEEAWENSMKLVKTADYFTIAFQGGTLYTGGLGGTFKAQGVRATVEGHWEADGKTRALSFSEVKVTGTETEVMAKAFIEGLTAPMTGYSGDNANLYLHYTDGQLKKVIGLVIR